MRSGVGAGGVWRRIAPLGALRRSRRRGTVHCFWRQQLRAARRVRGSSVGGRGGRTSRLTCANIDRGRSDQSDKTQRRQHRPHNSRSRHVRYGAERTARRFEKADSCLPAADHELTSRDVGSWLKQFAWLTKVSRPFPWTNAASRHRTKPGLLLSADLRSKTVQRSELSPGSEPCLSEGFGKSSSVGNRGHLPRSGTWQDEQIVASGTDCYRKLRSSISCGRRHRCRVERMPNYADRCSSHARTVGSREPLDARGWRRA